MQSERSHLKSTEIKLNISDFQTYDERNFVKVSNNVCYFENADVEIYFSIVNVGFLFKDDVLFALKHKKGLNLYELAITDHLVSRGTLLPLERMPAFEKIRRLNNNQKFTAKNKKITVTFDDNESWRLKFKNRDMYYNWKELLQSASKEKSLRGSPLSKELKRNFDYQVWRENHPNDRSNFFDSVLDVTSTFRREMEETKNYVGVNPTEIIGRFICERRDKQVIQKQLEESHKLDKLYKETILEIQKSSQI